MVDIRDNKVVVTTSGSMAVFGACAGTIMDLSTKEMDPIKSFNDLNDNKSDLDTDVFPQILIRADFEPYANTIGTRPFIILKVENLEYIGVLPGREAGNIFRIPRKYIKRIHNCGMYGDGISIHLTVLRWMANSTSTCMQIRYIRHIAVCPSKKHSLICVISKPSRAREILGLLIFLQFSIIYY